MSNRLYATVAAAAIALATLTASAQKQDPDVGGAPMYPTKTVVANASAAPNLTTLVAAVKAAGLVETLSGPGPFTVFAPTNDAFSKLPAGTVDTLTQPDNKAQLTGILTYHVVAGKIDAKKLMKDIKKGGGTAKLKTLQGEDLTFTMSGANIQITDSKGGTAMITTPDVFQSNGVAHIIDTVLMP